MKIGSSLLLLLFLLSCGHDTAKLLPGKWNVTSLNYPVFEKFAEKLPGNKGSAGVTSVFIHGDFYHFFDNGTYTSLSFGTNFTYGAWKWDPAAETIQLIPQKSGDTILLKIIRSGTKELIVQKDAISKHNQSANDTITGEKQLATGIEGLTIQLTLQKDINFKKSEENDYTSLYNNAWRIKPDTIEDYNAIAKRVRESVRFAVLYLSEAGAEQDISLDPVPQPLILTPNGIRLLDENEISTKWKRVFFNDNNALQGYHIFKDAFPSEEFKKGHKGIPLITDLLKKTLQKL